AGLFGAVLSRSARLEALQRAATRDKLTGLLNRNAEGLLAERLRSAGPDSPPSAVLVCDIDRFKSVNDTHGHDAGDAMIAGFARLVSGRVRSTDSALRWGRGEFVVGLPGASREVALGVAENIRARLARDEIDVGGSRSLRVTRSIGLAALAPGEELAQALRRADEALYQAENGGRDRVVAAG
ncbi:MAG: GGDEF domain-containing protein, partial [Alphaproteobacteria bacterium]|nr:GGDEF domain-containing protein [Alphaproteobacteria bacterium]